MTGTTRRRPQGEAEPRTCGPDSARGRPPDEAGRRRVPGFLVSALSRPVATGMALAACVGGVLARRAWEHPPDLPVLVIVAVASARGAGAGATFGFACGLFLDLAPGSAHAAGTAALGYGLAGHLAGRIAGDALTAAGTTGADERLEPCRASLLRRPAALVVAAMTPLGTALLAAVVLGEPVTRPMVLHAVVTAGPTIPAGLVVVPVLTGVLRRC